ncbi:MAG: Crp/Fnr family transcriptional regulator [Candidatus Bipolaricaulota bacterium]|nr:Crp/Fnr family transcriptional regulator [Candidatus Bipolaricaulota bacterium]MDW8110573.1 Crp/Fnr family transcriptional regulator [Candidatus Bipolaricaulota bacterium]MDW8329975.1 Crp/Fnr family transcriptional regulator [Candidatus Bipolaricaulota bacterium]
MKTQPLHEICCCCAVRDRCIFAEVGEELLIHRARWVRYAEREMIFHQGEPAFGLYIVYKGRVMLFKRALNGQRRILEIVGPAGVLGEEALLSEGEYGVSAQTLSMAQVLFIGRAEMQLFLEIPSVRQRLWERMLHRLHRVEELLLEARDLSAGERLARLLLRLAHEHGVPQPNGQLLLDLGVTQSELGEMVGLSREAVSKHLNRFKDQGLLGFWGRKLLIDPLGMIREGRAIESETELQRGDG